MTEVQSDSANINTRQYTYTYSEKNISLEVHYVGASMWVHFHFMDYSVHNRNLKMLCGGF